MMNKIIQLNGNSLGMNAFTLVEVMCSVMLLGILLSSVMTVYQRTTDGIVKKVMMEDAMEVAQRRMEILIASEQEPESSERSGQDDINESYFWSLELVREQVSDAPLTLKNSYIKATVTVGWEHTDSLVTVELVRFFSDLKPIEGQTVTVPIIANTQKPEWYDELVLKYERDPTQQDILEHMLLTAGIDIEEMEDKNAGFESTDSDDEDVIEDF
jgi:prepilin-type N-terminal cleavage/methylation domain-containing protein